MRLFTALLPALVALMAAGNGAWAADEIEPSVVKLAVTKREPDYLRPWTKASPSKVTGSGAVIAGGRILTNAHVVMHASEVFIQLREGGDQHTARVLAVAPGMDLALIEPVDPSLLASVPPLELADELPRLKSQVSVYGYPTGGEDLSITNGIVSRVEFTNYNFGAAGVRVQVDAALNPGNSGGPAIQDGRIIGLVFSGIREADNIGYLIPTEEIQTFLADVSDGAYDGKPSIFESYQTAENDAVRAFLEMTPETTGIIIADTTEGDDYPLRRWDVITHVGAHAVDNQGYVAVRDGLRLKFLYYVQKLAVDGFVELTILRDGESQIVRVPVQADRDLLIPPLKDQYPEYFIYGPLVFSAATQEYVRGLGSTGLAMLLALDSPMLKRLQEPPSEPEEQLVIVASRVFPHPIAKGYDNRPLGVIESMNGEPVTNLRRLAEMLRDCQDEYIRFEMADRSESLVFRTAQLRESTEEVLTDEGIRYQSSESLRDVFAE